MKNLYQQSYTVPVISRIESWVTQNIHRPIKGFERKRNQDGSLFTKQQQISSTRLQVLAIAIYFLNRGKTDTEIMRLLRHFQ